MKQVYATIDLGSNSFHMLIASLEYDEIKSIDSLSEKVMLAEGLSKESGISADARERGLQCIQRLAHRIQSVPKKNIRIVGTNTLRAAVNAKDFVKSLEAHLNGIIINTISGAEEARLIYLGVSHTWSSNDDSTNHLVVDIGGGSTEFIIGKKFKSRVVESLRMGCVAYRRFFPKDKITSTYFDQAEQAAEVELLNIVSCFTPDRWSNVVGSAGSFKAISQLCISQGFCQEGIPREGLYKLRDKLLTFQNMDELELDGLKELRKKTIVSGVAIALAIFKCLKIEHMHISRGGLREGILYDLVGRHKAEDIRERSIRALSQRYGLEEKCIKLNKRILKTLLDNCDFEETKILLTSQKQYLFWAARCSQIGLAISHSQYQNHSAYLIENSELDGFTLSERKILAILVKNHRRKIKSNSIDELDFIAEQRESFLTAIFINRLVFIIGQNGKYNDCDRLRIKLNKDEILIHIPDDWARDNSLIVESLKKEKVHWEIFNICLNFIQ